MSDETWMKLALSQAHQAAALGEVPVGAVVVKHGQVIAIGRNAPIERHDPTAHAEIMALRAAAQVLGNYRLDDCELFVTLEPCAMCSGAILQSRLKRVVFGATEPKTGAAGSVINLFAHTGFNHHTQLRGGVLALESATLLQKFFHQRRIAQRTAAQQQHPLREDALRTPEKAFARLFSDPWPVHYMSDLPTLGGLRMHYLDEKSTGNENTLSTATALTSSTPLTFLCLHDGESWSYQYHTIIPNLLNAGYRIIAPDLIGFGKSDKPKKDSFHTFSCHHQILLEFIKKLDLQHIVLVVQSSSDLLGLSLPLIEPQRYDGLWIMNKTTLKPEQRSTPSTILQKNGNHNDEHCDVYHIPFPDKGHCAALRAFKKMPTRDKKIEQFWSQQWTGWTFDGIGIQALINELKSIN